MAIPDTRNNHKGAMKLYTKSLPETVTCHECVLEREREQSCAPRLMPSQQCGTRPLPAHPHYQFLRGHHFFCSRCASQSQPWSSPSPVIALVGTMSHGWSLMFSRPIACRGASGEGQPARMDLSWKRMADSPRHAYEPCRGCSSS